MRRVTSEQTQYKLLQELDSAGHTPLHLAAHRNTTQAIRIIADSVSSHHLIHLLTITDHGLGYTSVQFAAAWRDNQVAEKTLLLVYHTSAYLIVSPLQNKVIIQVNEMV